MKERESSIHFEKRNQKIALIHDTRSSKKEPSYLLQKKYRKNNEFEFYFDTKELYQKSKEIFKNRRGKHPSFEKCYCEAVVNLNENHTLTDVKKVALKITEIFGYKITEIAVHRDEGHTRINNSGEEEVIYNYHAHIGCYTLDNNAKQLNRNPRIMHFKCKQLQTEVAAVLNMKRGKENSKKIRLSAKEFRNKKKQENKEQDLNKQKEINKNLIKSFENEKEEINYDRENYSRKSFNRERFDLPVLRECDVADTRSTDELVQKSRMSVQVTKNNELQQLREREENNFLHRILDEKGCFVIDNVVTTQKQLNSIKSVVRKEMIDMQTFKQSDYKKLNEIFNKLKISLKTDKQLTLNNIDEVVSRIINKQTEQIKELTQVAINANNLTQNAINNIKSEIAKSNNLKTQLDKKNKEIDLLKAQLDTEKKLTSNAVQETVKLKNQLKEFNVTVKNNADLKVELEKKDKELQEKAEALRLKEQMLNSQTQTQTTEISDKKRIEVIKSATEEELEEYNEHYQSLVERFSEYTKNVAASVLRLCKAFFTRDNTSYEKAIKSPAHLLDEVSSVLERENENEYEEAELQQKEVQTRKSGLHL